MTDRAAAINGGRIIMPADARTYVFGGLKVVTTATIDELAGSGKVVEALVVACCNERDNRDAEIQSLTQLCEALSDEIVLLRKRLDDVSRGVVAASLDLE